MQNAAPSYNFRPIPLMLQNVEYGHFQASTSISSRH